MLSFGSGFGLSSGPRAWNRSVASITAWLALNGDLITAADGSRFLVNSKGNDVAVNSGQGKYINGITQNITLTFPTAYSVAYFKEGVFTYEEYPLGITEYLLSSVGVYQGFIAYDITLSDAQKYDYSTYPERITVNSSGKTVPDIGSVDNCVCFSPMWEKTTRVIDYVNHFEGTTNAEVTSIYKTAIGIGNTISGDFEGNFVIHNEVSTNANYQPLIKLINANFIVGEKYLIEVDFTVTSGAAMAKSIQCVNGTYIDQVFTAGQSYSYKTIGNYSEADGSFRFFCDAFSSYNTVPTNRLKKVVGAAARTMVESELTSATDLIFTQMITVKNSTPSDSDYISAKVNGNSNTGMDMFQTGAGFVMYFGGSSYHASHTPDDIEHRFGVVYNGTNQTLKTYLDGILKNSYTGVDKGTIYRIGYLFESDTSETGSIRNVQRWTQEFTDAQMLYDATNEFRALYSSNGVMKTENADVDVGNCVQWLPCQEGSGTTILDVSKNESFTLPGGVEWEVDGTHNDTIYNEFDINISMKATKADGLFLITAEDEVCITNASSLQTGSQNMKFEQLSDGSRGRYLGTNTLVGDGVSTITLPEPVGNLVLPADMVVDGITMTTSGIVRYIKSTTVQTDENHIAQKYSTGNYILLSEISNNALQDSNGEYILDANGDYIYTTEGA